MSRPKIDNPDLPLTMVFDLWPPTVSVFLSQGMACFGCPVAPFHTVVDACQEYRLDEDRFRNALQLALSNAGDPNIRPVASSCGRKPPD